MFIMVGIDEEQEKYAAILKQNMKCHYWLLIQGKLVIYADHKLAMTTQVLYAPLSIPLQ